MDLLGEMNAGYVAGAFTSKDMSDIREVTYLFVVFVCLLVTLSRPSNDLAWVVRSHPNPSSIGGSGGVTYFIHLVLGGGEGGVWNSMRAHSCFF
jgi:hypothetical protein